MGGNDSEPGQPWLGAKHSGQEAGPRQGRKQVRPCVSRLGSVLKGLVVPSVGGWRHQVLQPRRAVENCMAGGACSSGPAALPGAVGTELGWSAPGDLPALQPWWLLLCWACALPQRLLYPEVSAGVVLTEAPLASGLDARCTSALTWCGSRVFWHLSGLSLVVSLLFCSVSCMCSFVKQTRGTVTRSSSVSSVNSP